MIVAVMCVMAMAASVNAQTVTYEVARETKMTVSGTSTLHAWTSTVEEVKGEVVLDKELASGGKLTKGGGIEKVHIVVPVKAIKAPRGAAMDKKTYEALKAEEHPEIVFDLTDNTIKSVKSDTMMIHAKGMLEIAGVKKEVAMDVKGVRVRDGRFVFKGDKSINMKEYDMTPPSAMFGQIETGEEVTIAFELVVLD